MKIQWALPLLFAAMVPVGMGAQQPSTGQDEVKTLVQRFLAAEKAYDAPALARLIDESYVEVSPAGEVDERERFLGFYAADKKTDWPPMSTSEEQVRIFGDTAIEVVRFTYQMPGSDDGTHPREFRGSFIAQKRHGEWKLLGAQYTGIRTPQNGQ